MLARPSRGVRNLVVVARGRQHLRQQWIRIECDGPNHLIELLGRESRGRRVIVRLLPVGRVSRRRILLLRRILARRITLLRVLLLLGVALLWRIILLRRIRLLRRWGLGDERRHRHPSCERDSQEFRNRSHASPLCTARSKTQYAVF